MFRIQSLYNWAHGKKVTAPGPVPSPPPPEPLRAAGVWPRPGFEESPPETAGLSFPEFPESREEEAAQPRIPNSADRKNSPWPD